MCHSHICSCIVNEFSTISVHQPSRSSFKAWCFTVQGSRLIPAASDISVSDGLYWKLHNWSKITQGKIVTHRESKNLNWFSFDRAVLQRLRLTFPALFLLHAHRLHVQRFCLGSLSLSNSTAFSINEASLKRWLHFFKVQKCHTWGKNSR